MKTKYFFGMLLSGALLAACTADDDFNTTKVAQEANPAAPVFTAHFDNGSGNLQNRAYWNPDGNKVGFEAGDKLSLFHGGSGMQGVSYSSNGYQNAVYKGAVDDETGEFTFTTQAMVQPGRAIMVYPADETFYNNPNGGTAYSLFVSIPTIQDKTTKEKTPYISDFLDIKINPGNNDTQAAAGYGKNYDIYLRRLASTLSLTINVTKELTLPEGVEANTMEDVVLRREDGGSFTKHVRLAPDQTYVPTDTIYGTDENGDVDSTTWWTQGYYDVNQPNARDDEEGVLTSWAAQVLAQSNYYDNQGNLPYTNYLQTSDIEDGVAKFTLLPTDNENGNVTKGSVQFDSRYGKVVLFADISDEDAAQVWHKGNTKMNVGAGLKDLNSNKVLWADATKGVFKGEKVGGHISRSIDVDLSKVIMDGLHIKDQKHLMDALTVYNSTTTQDAANTTITFYLDGDKNKEFVMEKAAWEMMNAQASKSKKVDFVPCLPGNGQGAHKCETIVLKNTANAAEEVPSLNIGGNVAVPVKLDGEWKYSAVTKTSNYKKYTNVSKLVVNSDATLKLTNWIANNANVGIENNGTVAASGEALLYVEMTNFNTITIGTSDLLRVTTGGSLINREATGKKDTGWTEGAKIENAGVLGIVDDTDGKISNYGVINVKNATARTLISDNADDNVSAIATGKVDIKTIFGNGNNGSSNYRIGTINLFSATTKANNRTVVNGKQGFLKIKVDMNNPSAGADSIGQVANYVILGEKCTSVNSKLTGTNSNVKYLEVSNGKEVKVAGSVELEGVFVTNNSVLDITQQYTLKVNQYLNLSAGRIYRAGTLSGNYRFTGYFGGKADDQKNITTFNAQ